MDLPELGTVNDFGSWDLRGRFDEYVGNVDLAGNTLLDVVPRAASLALRPKSAARS